MRALPYREGDWFAVPLGDTKHALCRIARHHQGIVFVYVFAPALDRPPTLADAAGLTASDSLTQMLVSHLDLRDGAWPVLGQEEGWDPTAWPLVEFERRVETPGRPDELHAVLWDERDLSQEAGVRRLDSSEAGRRPRDTLSGAGAAVVRLRQALGL